MTWVFSNSSFDMWKGTNDIELDKHELNEILAMQGSYVIVEKFISLSDLRLEWSSNNPFHDRMKEIARSFSNLKLWRMISIAQGMKEEIVKQQKFEDAAFLRDVERTSAETLVERRRRKNS
jgi:hypothetical protein